MCVFMCLCVCVCACVCSSVFCVRMCVCVVCVCVCARARVCRGGALRLHACVHLKFLRPNTLCHKSVACCTVVGPGIFHALASLSLLPVNNRYPRDCMTRGR
jgi:hypothetical protein